MLLANCWVMSRWNIAVRELVVERENLSTVLTISKFSLLFFHEMFKQANLCVTHVENTMGLNNA